MPTLTLEREAQAELVRLTRATLEAAVRRLAGPTDGEVTALMERFPELEQPGGAFVTIYVDQLLRGCLGEIESADPVACVVLRCAQRVPRHDHRFDRVNAGELGRLTFKVSLLSTLEPLPSPDRIQLGTDGLLVRHDGHCGLLLPDVPTEYGWDTPTFLRNLWRKAGIPAAVPFDAARVWSFNTLIIYSQDFPMITPMELD